MGALGRHDRVLLYGADLAPDASAGPGGLRGDLWRAAHLGDYDDRRAVLPYGSRQGECARHAADCLYRQHELYWAGHVRGGAAAAFAREGPANDQYHQDAGAAGQRRVLPGQRVAELDAAIRPAVAG